MKRNLEKVIVPGARRIAVGCLVSLALMLSACADGWENGLENPTPATGHAALVGVPTDQDCASIAGWVAENAANLPASYDELAELPIAYRRAIFNALSPAARSSLWQQHFQAYLAAHPELTPDQRAFVEEMHAAMSPELFLTDQAMASSDELTALIGAAEPRAAALFPQSELPGLLATLGPSEAARPSEAAQPGTEAISCECNDDDDWCWYRWPFGSYTCVAGAEGCDFQPLGCGELWGKPCNGLCIRR